MRLYVFDSGTGEQNKRSVQAKMATHDAELTQRLVAYFSFVLWGIYNNYTSILTFALIETILAQQRRTTVMKVCCRFLLAIYSNRISDLMLCSTVGSITGHLCTKITSITNVARNYFPVTYAFVLVTMTGRSN